MADDKTNRIPGPSEDAGSSWLRQLMAEQAEELDKVLEAYAADFPAGVSAPQSREAESAPQEGMQPPAPTNGTDPSAVKDSDAPKQAQAAAALSETGSTSPQKAAAAGADINRVTPRRDPSRTRNIPGMNYPTEEQKTAVKYRTLAPADEMMTETAHPVKHRRKKNSFRLLGNTGSKSKAAVIILCGVAGILLVSCILLLLTTTGVLGGSSSQTILNNVIAAGVNVGGMTEKEAAKAISAAGDPWSETDMLLELPDETLTFTPKSTGAKLDAKAAAKAAVEYGHTGTTAEQNAAYNRSLSSSYTLDILPCLNLDEDYIRSAIQDYADRCGSLYVPSGWELEGDLPALEADEYDPDAPCQTLVLTVGSPGADVDTEALLEKVLDAYRAGTFRVTQKKLSSNTLPEALDIDQIYDQVRVAPVDAEVDQQTGEASPAVYGLTFDLEDARAQLDAAEYGDVIRIPLEYVEPDTVDAQGWFADVLGECQTPHTDNANRNTNLRLLCAALDGLVLQPGETLSYNDVLGERTAAKGYMSAPAYSGYDLVDAVGGGVCQGSSTLYWCALLADLEIVERVNHGYVSSYIDYGLDATVSWPSPDLKIRNNKEYPVKIRAEVSDGYVKMKILGTETRSYYIEMTYELNWLYPGTVYQDVEPDSGYKDGDVIQEGVTGCSVTTYKTKYDRATGDQYAVEWVANSRYICRNKIIARVIWDNETEAAAAPTAAAAEEPVETAPPETSVPDETEAPESTEAAQTDPSQADEDPAEIDSAA